MNYFKRRKLKKLVHHLLHEARHARHMREDILPDSVIDQLRSKEIELKNAMQGANAEQVGKAADALSETLHQVYPPHKSPRLRENIEIIVVAISVAMAFRTFFVQPFRIPTGSMQPTLYGITHEYQSDKSFMDRFPLSILSFILFGEQYKEVKARATGVITFQEYVQNTPVFRVAGVPHVIPMDMPRHFELGKTLVKKGDVLASGKKKLGDHIFVNRLWYNFVPPKRGDIFVFSTRDIKHPDIRPDNYYIKRLVGLPGESISIRQPYLYADGKKVTEPATFQRQIKGEGYNGYLLVGTTPTPALLRNSSDTIKLGENEYLPFGDNTQHSLDGRFFGGVDHRSIIGPAFMVYWPFGHRWGLVE